MKVTDRSCLHCVWYLLLLLNIIGCTPKTQTSCIMFQTVTENGVVKLKNDYATTTFTTTVGSDIQIQAIHVSNNIVGYKWDVPQGRAIELQSNPDAPTVSLWADHEGLSDIKIKFSVPISSSLSTRTPAPQTVACQGDQRDLHFSVEAGAAPTPSQSTSAEPFPPPPPPPSPPPIQRTEPKSTQILTGVGPCRLILGALSPIKLVGPPHQIPPQYVEGSSVVLRWEAVRALKDDEWYDVNLRLRSHDRILWGLGDRVKGTQFVFNNQTVVQDQGHQFEWDVTLISTSDPHSSDNCEFLTSIGEPWTFYWYPSVSNAAVTPGATEINCNPACVIRHANCICVGP